MNESLDELVGRFCGALDAERGGRWTAGDIVNAAIDDMRRRVQNPRQFRAGRASVLRTFAKAGHCTTTYVAQIADVSGAFGTEQRYPDVSLPFYQAIVRACRRVRDEQGRPVYVPGQLLDDALAKAWHVADVNALGRTVPVQAECAGDCPDCGAKVRLIVPGDRLAQPDLAVAIRCPLCTGRVLRDGGDAREAWRIGQLAGLGEGEAA